ncbi:MAG: hypothetical protein ACRDVG_08160 [Jatrophihabitantaceae bacterium]
MGSLLRRLIAVVALAVGIGVSAGTAAAATPVTHATVHSHSFAQADDWWF